MKVFITGATGFVGRHLVPKLISENIEVVINLRKGKESPFDDRVSVWYSDENNIQRDIDFFIKEGFNGVIHLASLYITNHKAEEIKDLIDSNVRFAAHILECAVKSETSWFINTGTFWQHYENKEYSPVNLYAATKQAFESIAQYYIESEQIKFYTLKLSDTYGPNDTRPKIFNLWDRIAKNEETIDMSPGQQLIDICYIDDVISAYYILITNINNRPDFVNNGEDFVVKAKKRYSLIELAKIFERVVGVKLNINWGKRKYRNREVMVPYKNGKTVIEWEQDVTIEEGIKRTFIS